MKNGKKNGLMSYEQLHELLQMTALQTSENAKQLQRSARDHDREMAEIRKERLAAARLHDREMKEIRALFQKMIKRIAA